MSPAGPTYTPSTPGGASELAVAGGIDQHRPPMPAYAYLYTLVLALVGATGLWGLVRWWGRLTDTADPPEPTVERWQGVTGHPVIDYEIQRMRDNDGEPREIKP